MLKPANLPAAKISIKTETPLTLTEITGPTQLQRKLMPANEAHSNNLAQPFADKPRAAGQLIQVGGRVLDEDGMPVKHTIIELWHANASGTDGPSSPPNDS